MLGGTCFRRCARMYFASIGCGPGPDSTQATSRARTTQRMARSLYDQIGRVLEQRPVCRLACDDELLDLLHQRGVLLRDDVEVLLREAQEDRRLEGRDVRDRGLAADE